MRTWKSNPFVGAGLLVVIVGAGWLTYRTVKSPRRHVEYSYVVKCINPECINPHPERIFEASYPEGRKPPFECPFCGSPAYPAVQCRICDLIFPLRNNPFRRPPYLCPDCRKRSAFPLEPGQVPLETPPPKR